LGVCVIGLFAPFLIMGDIADDGLACFIVLANGLVAGIAEELPIRHSFKVGASGEVRFVNQMLKGRIRKRRENIIMDK